MKITLSSKWIPQPWRMPIWDDAYSHLIRAGAGDAHAKREIDGIKAAAAAGIAMWQQVKVNFDAVAKLVLKGLPKPSTFTRGRVRPSPLLPQGAASTAPAASTAQAALIRRQQEQIKELRRQQVERAKQQSRAARVQQRFKSEQEKHDAELTRVEDQLAAVQKVLERRDLADEMRKQLEDQADQYEALIDKLRAGGPSAEATTTSEAMAAEQVEAEQDDAADAYPTGAPGDVEFNDAGH